jgi:hypothetical protein
VTDNGCYVRKRKIPTRIALMNEVWSSIADVIRASSPYVGVVIGAVLGFLANVVLTWWKNRREDRDKQGERDRAAAADKRERGRTQADEALRIALEAYGYLTDTDENVELARRLEGATPGEQLPPPSMTTFELIGPAIERWMTQIELVHSGQIPDPERRVLIEQAAGAVSESVSGPAARRQLYGSATPGMRRHALRCMVGVLTTYLADEPVSYADKEYIERYWDMWGKSRQTPTDRAAQQPPEAEAAAS